MLSIVLPLGLRSLPEYASIRSAMYQHASAWSSCDTEACRGYRALNKAAQLEDGTADLQGSLFLAW